jgi:antitoxin (DNA-binding transcriptional repressor) of toxin-antitoxin stability system
MIRIDVAEAEAIFDEMLDKVEQGETFVLLRNGEPIATIVPPAAPSDAENRPASP